nr:translation initiation factor IF-2-like [Manis javanica]
MGWSGPEFGVIRLGALHSRSHLKAPPALERDSQQRRKRHSKPLLPAPRGPRAQGGRVAEAPFPADRPPLGRGGCSGSASARQPPRLAAPAAGGSARAGPGRVAASGAEWGPRSEPAAWPVGRGLSLGRGLRGEVRTGGRGQGPRSESKARRGSEFGSAPGPGPRARAGAGRGSRRGPRPRGGPRPRRRHAPQLAAGGRRGGPIEGEQRARPRGQGVAGRRPPLCSPALFTLHEQSAQDPD